MKIQVVLGTLTAFAVAACQIDFVGPDPQPAQIWGQLSFEDQSPSTWTLDAHLAPGQTENGTLRTVTEEALVVLGAAVRPFDVDPEKTTFSFADTLTLDPSKLPDSTITFVAPLVSGAGEVPNVKISAVWRAGSDSITAPRGTDVTVQIAVGAQVVPHTTWIVRTFQFSNGGSVFEAHGYGYVPGTIAIPGAAIRDTTATGFRIELTVQQSVAAESSTGNYRAIWSTTSTLTWLVFPADIP